MTPSLLICRVLDSIPALDRGDLLQQLTQVRKRRMWPGPHEREPECRYRLLDALHVSPGMVPFELKMWLLSLPRDEAQPLVADLLAVLEIYMRRMPTAARSLAVEDW